MKPIRRTVASLTAFLLAAGLLIARWYLALATCTTAAIHDWNDRRRWKQTTRVDNDTGDPDYRPAPIDDTARYLEHLYRQPAAKKEPRP